MNVWEELVNPLPTKQAEEKAPSLPAPQLLKTDGTRPYPGALIVVEGTDGSGKSTQLYLLKRWLEIGGYRLHFTEWNSSPLVKSATRRGKQRRLLTPTTFSLLHAADFADRCERQIMPLLQGDYLVLADRYVYTAFARDAARGCPARWLRNLYRFAPVPDITFYFRAPLDVAVHRILSGRPKLKYYEAGMDLGLSYDRAESFRLFQARILEEYDKMVDTDNFVVLDGSIRSTQIALLQEWLESEGFAVQTSGLRRSNLVGRDIDELLAKNAVTRLTLALMYATDFFDQVEHRVLPALRSGTVVLADRFIFTLIARGVVRGINRD